MVILFVFSTSNYTLWNNKNLKSRGTQTEKTPQHVLERYNETRALNVFLILRSA